MWRLHAPDGAASSRRAAASARSGTIRSMISPSASTTRRTSVSGRRSRRLSDGRRLLLRQRPRGCSPGGSRSSRWPRSRRSARPASTSGSRASSASRSGGRGVHVRLRRPLSRSRRSAPRASIASNAHPWHDGDGWLLRDGTERDRGAGRRSVPARDRREISRAIWGGLAPRLGRADALGQSPGDRGAGTGPRRLRLGRPALRHRGPRPVAAPDGGSSPCGTPRAPRATRHVPGGLTRIGPQHRVRQALPAPRLGVGPRSPLMSAA